MSDFVKVDKTLLKSDLSAEEKLLYVCLLSYLPYDCKRVEVYPSITTLQRDCSMSRKRVIKNLDLLEEKKLIVRIGHPGKNTKYVIKSYLPDLPDPRAEPKKPTKKNGFSNFHQRDYVVDDELEKKLLNRK